MTSSEQLTEKQIEQIRRDVAKAYNDLMIDLALKGEGIVGRRRFWRDEDNVIRWEDLPEAEPEGDGTDGDPGDGAGAEVPEPAASTQNGNRTRARKNRRAALIARQGNPEGHVRNPGRGGR